MRPRVTLAIPVYNGEKFIVEAIKSILRQDYADFELIITDNASTDSTETICRKFAAADARIKYVRNARNLGAGPNFNKGFELSSGEFFKWCACDDYISSDYVGACVRALDANPDAVLAYGATQPINQEGSPILALAKKMPEMADAQPARRFYKAVTTTWEMDQEAFGLFRSDALSKTTLHRPYYGSDLNLLREMALLGRFVHVPHIIFYNRDHDGRSEAILGEKEKRLWQDASTSSKRSVSSIPFFAHLFEIAIRHRLIVSPAKTLPPVLILALSPRSLAGYVIELISVASPSAGQWLLTTCRRVKRWLLPRSKARVGQCQ